MNDQNNDRAPLEPFETLTDDQIVTEKRVARRSFLSRTGALLTGAAGIVAAARASTSGNSRYDDPKRPDDPDKRPADQDKRPEDRDRKADPDKRREDPDKRREDPDKRREDPDKRREDPDKRPADPDKRPADPDKPPSRSPLK